MWNGIHHLPVADERRRLRQRAADGEFFGLSSRDGRLLGCLCGKLTCCVQELIPGCGDLLLQEGGVTLHLDMVVVQQSLLGFKGLN